MPAKTTNETTKPSGSDAPTCSPRDLAARIALRLFTNGFGNEGTRLEIKLATGHNQEQSLGGWCYGAAFDQIENVLRENETSAAAGSERPSQ